MVANGATVRLDDENAPQPDAVLMLRPDCGGQAKIAGDGVLEGPPELVAEVFTEDDALELMARKRSLYQRHGVREYIVWLPHENRLDWLVLENDKYVSLLPDGDSVIRRRVFPGLWLAVEAMLAEDMAQVGQMLQQPEFDNCWPPSPKPLAPDFGGRGTERENKACGCFSPRPLLEEGPRVRAF